MHIAFLTALVIMAPALMPALGSVLAIAVCVQAVKVLGGYGVMKEHEVKRCLRDILAFQYGQ